MFTLQIKTNDNMKNKLMTLAVVMTVFFASCDELTSIAETATSTVGGGETAAPALTNDEVIAGLKEALTVGINNGSRLASATDGFFKNPAIKLPFPPDAKKVIDKAIDLGLQNKVDQFELTLNRAAEEATKEAGPIFIQAIKDMSIGDGFTILKGADNAATNYLRDKTTSKLVSAFSPKVKIAIDKVQLTKYWTPLTKAYNTANILTGGSDVNTDLNAFVTERAIKGLFLLVEKEEKNIRKDPLARATDILKKVFSFLD
jgi:hypothetical protein